jgi:hypothetical protein
MNPRATPCLGTAGRTGVAHTRGTTVPMLWDLLYVTPQELATRAAPIALYFDLILRHRCAVHGRLALGKRTPSIMRPSRRSYG